MDEQQQKKEDTIHSIKGEKFIIKPIRTYEDDVANLVKNKDLNTTKIVLAEQKRKRRDEKNKKLKEVESVSVPKKPGENTEGKHEIFKHEKEINDQRVEKVEPSKEQLTHINQGAILNEKTTHKTKPNKVKKIKKNRKPLPYKKILSIVLILLGIGLILSAIIFTGLGSKIAQITSVEEVLETGNEVIDNEYNIVITADNKTAREIRKDIQDNIYKEHHISPKDILEIKITKNSISDSGSSGTQKISTVEFLRVLEASTPSELIRSLSSDYMLGVINIGEIKPFLLLKTNDLDQTYSQMFTWEPVLYRDINDIFLSLGSEDFYNPNETILDFDPRVYKDEILLNKDVRAVINVNREIVFFYSFIDSEHLLMTTDIEVMREIIQRLNTQRLIR